MTDVGELVLRIRADSSQFQQELNQTTSATKESAQGMTGAFESVKGALESLGIALSAGALIEFTKAALEAADNLYIMAQRIGFSSETLSALNVPLKQNGSSVDEFSNSIKFMNRNIDLAGEGNTMLLDKFDQLGLSVTKLKSLRPEEQFYSIAKALGETSDQGQLTADAMAILGRGAGGLIPIIKETKGNIQELVQAQKDLGNTLTDDEIRKVHEYNDAWITFVERLKVKVVEATLSIHQLIESSRQLANEDTLSGVGGHGSAGKGTASTIRPQTVSMATFLGDQANFPASQYDPNFTPSAKGNNADIENKGKVAPTSELDAYIKNLQGEADALSKSKEALELYKVEHEAAAKAQTDFTNGLRASPTLTGEEKDQIDAATQAYINKKKALEEATKEQEKQIQVVAQMESQISSALATSVTNFKNLGTAITNVLQQVSKEILQLEVTTPLVDGIASAFGAPTKSSAATASSGGAAGTASLWSTVMGALPHFASGGYTAGNSPIVVGDGGEPEIFTPGTSGTITPMSQMGGTNASVTQNINLSPGLSETVNAAIMNAAPIIAAQAHASVLLAIQKGGNDARVVGRR